MIPIVVSYIVLSLAAIASRQLGWKYAPLCKGLPVGFLIAALALEAAAGLTAARAPYFVIIGGLVLGLVGDILFLDKGRFFKQGIVAFLGGHILYIVAFALSGMKPTWRMLVPTVAYFGIYAIVLVNILLAKHGKYRPIAIAYLAGIFMMTASALFADAANASRGLSTYFFEGAFLFTISDGVLSYRVFQGRFRLVDLIVLSTYYAAQGIIAWNAWVVAGGFLG